MQTILAVDDEEESLMMVEHTLSSDYRIVAVNSGAMAIKYLQKEIPDLILLDVKMPQMDGYEVLNIIRETEKWMKIPVIFLSSYANTYNEEELRMSGVADYIGKPVDSITMRNRVSRAMTTLDSQKRKMAFHKLKRMNTTEKAIASVPIMVDHVEVRLTTDKILYIEEYNKICAIQTKHMEIKSKMSLDKIQSFLGDNFIKIRKNILINTDYVKTISDGKIIMENGKSIVMPRLSDKKVSQQLIEKMKNRIGI